MYTGDRLPHSPSRGAGKSHVRVRRVVAGDIDGPDGIVPFLDPRQAPNLVGVVRDGHWSDR